MTETWARGTLSDLVIDDFGIKSGPFGTSLSAAEYGEEGVPVISVGEVGYGELRLRSDTPRVGAEVTSRLPEYLLREGDIVFGRKGAVDRSAWVSSTQDGWFLGSDGLRVRTHPGVDSRFVAFQLRGTAAREWLLRHAGGSTLLSLNQGTLARVPIVIPPLAEQQAIAEVLGALDDKIAANTALAATAASLARIELLAANRDGTRELSIDAASTLLARGITPRYSPDGEGTRVLNQKCVRGQVISLHPSRWTESSRVKPEKLLIRGDVLVNSTGQGTLGRVARWTLPERATVDSHITIMRPDPQVGDPMVIGQAVLAIEADIEGLGEGSTGQTELSRVELGRARIRVPSGDRATRLGETLCVLSAVEDAARAENRTLAATRDALLPQLMSGKLRVRDVEAMASEAGV